jgi:hypothetical protein
MHEFLKSIPGASELFAWFGYWPDFHDAEIISLVLNRSGPSVLSIRTWHTTDQVDERGCFIKEKHVVLSFQMEEILDLTLSNFSQQNVIYGLEISKVKQEYKLVLDPRYGLAGSIRARRLSMEVAPWPEGAPERSL